MAEPVKVEETRELPPMTKEPEHAWWRWLIGGILVGFGILVVIMLLTPSSESQEADLETRVFLLETRVSDHETRIQALEAICNVNQTPTDPCFGVICQPNTQTCPDGFRATCENTCFTGQCTNCTPDCSQHQLPPPPTTDNRTIVIMDMDDMQAWWLESTAKKIGDLHIQKGIPLTIGAIAEGLAERDGVVDGFTETLQKWNTENKDVIEIAAHTFDHCCSYSGWTLTKQVTDIKKAKAEFAKFGINTTTFIPAYDWGNSNTVLAINQSGFLVGLDAQENYYVENKTREPMILEGGNWYGAGFSKWDYATISKMIDDSIKRTGKDYFVLAFHQQDFQSSSSINSFSLFLDQIKSSGKYRFMTATQYYRHKNERR